MSTVKGINLPVVDIVIIFCYVDSQRIFSQIHYEIFSLDSSIRVDSVLVNNCPCI